jgi:hypothetical protein
LYVVLYSPRSWTPESLARILVGLFRVIPPCQYPCIPDRRCKNQRQKLLTSDGWPINEENSGNRHVIPWMDQYATTSDQTWNFLCPSVICFQKPIDRSTSICCLWRQRLGITTQSEQQPRGDFVASSRKQYAMRDMAVTHVRESCAAQKLDVFYCLTLGINIQWQSLLNSTKGSCVWVGGQTVF